MPGQHSRADPGGRDIGKQGWTQGKMQGLVQKKVACIKDLQEVETQKQDLPLHFQHTLESAVQEELQAQGIMATAKIVLASRVPQHMDRPALERGELNIL